MIALTETGETCLDRSDSLAVPALHAERCRGAIVWLVMIVYWLLIFEGALRKWILPAFQRELFFIRDPFVLSIYIMCIICRIWPRQQLLTIVAIVLMWLGGLLIVLQSLYGLIADRTGVLLAIYGWREYFLLIPLAFVIGECFTRKDLKRLVKSTLFISIPIALLSFLQASAPQSGRLNAGIAENPANIFVPLGVSVEFMRTSGTFTSNEGHALFIGSLISMVLWVWMLPRDRRPLGKLALFLVTGGVLANLAVSGQRLAFLLALAVILTGVSAAVLLPKHYLARRAFKITAGLLVGALVTMPIFFGRQLDALASRAAGAAVGDDWYSYGILNRLIGDFTHFSQILPDTPGLGYGLGTAGNGSVRMGVIAPVSAEDDWSRNIVDLGPILGSLFIVFRIVLLVSLMVSAIAAARRWADPLPLLFLGFVGSILLYGQITGQGSVNGYAWLFVGFTIAACSTSSEEALF